mmetsp:Transcript_15585/g.48249  ORF Transcript_15585/g.48249 Transcript_15585/m.48249 type:complete len:131 (-) Transcript_15585:397-789(-)
MTLKLIRKEEALNRLSILRAEEKGQPVMFVTPDKRKTFVAAVSVALENAKTVPLAFFKDDVGRKDIAALRREVKKTRGPRVNVVKQQRKMHLTGRGRRAQCKATDAAHRKAFDATALAQRMTNDKPPMYT